MGKSARCSLAVVTLAAAPAIAGDLCARIEYADARDWPINKLEAAYCESNRGMYEAIIATQGLSRREAAPLLRQSDHFAEMQALFQRVIENVHKRAAPKCSR